MAPPLPHAGGARPSLERGGLSSTHRRGEGAAPGKLAALWIDYPRSVLGAPSPRRSSSRIAVARFGIRVWNRNSSIAAISSVDTLNCKRSVRSGVDSVPHASLALILPGRLAITPPPEKCEKKSSAAQKSSGWRGRNSRCGTYICCMLFERRA